MKLCVDNLLVFHRIDRSTALAHHIVVVEATDDVDDGIALADVAQKLIAKAFALAGTFHKASDIYYLTRGGNNSSRMYNLGKLGQSLVGNDNDAQVGLYRTEREVGCLSFGARQTIEQCGLTHVGQSHDTTF